MATTAADPVLDPAVAAVDSGDWHLPWPVSVVVNGYLNRESEQPVSAWSRFKTKLKKGAVAAEKGQVTFYRIVVTWPSVPTLRWQVFRRFNHFVELRDRLAVHMPNPPDLGANRNWFQTHDEAFLRSRVSVLHHFLQRCMQIPLVLNSIELARFLDFGKHLADLSRIRRMYLPRPIMSIDISDTHPGFAISDFHYVQGEHVLICTAERTAVLSKAAAGLDAYRKSGSDPDQKVANYCGAILCYGMDDDGVFKQRFSFNTLSGISCLEWLSDRRQIAVGLHNGQILIMKLGDQFQDCQVYNEICYHQAKITGLRYDSQRGRLYTCAYDKSVGVYDFRNERPDAQIGGSYFTSIEVSPDGRTLFVGTYGQRIKVLDVSGSGDPRVVNTLCGHKGSVRCLATTGDGRFLFSGAFDKNVGVWDFRNPDPSLGRALGFWAKGAEHKLTACQWLDRLQLLVAGTDNGDLVFWDVHGRLWHHIAQTHSHRTPTGRVWSPISRLQWANDSCVLMSGAGSSVRFWDVSRPAYPRRQEIFGVAVGGAEADEDDGACRPVLLENLGVDRETRGARAFLHGSAHPQASNSPRDSLENFLGGGYGSGRGSSDEMSEEKLQQLHLHGDDGEEEGHDFAAATVDVEVAEEDPYVAEQHQQQPQQQLQELEDDLFGGNDGDDAAAAREQEEGQQQNAAPTPEEAEQVHEDEEDEEDEEEVFGGLPDQDGGEDWSI